MPESTDCLVIPDIHQHIAWADAVLSREASRVARIVFLGDYFDPKLPLAASPSETAQFVCALESAYPRNEFTFLVGNHDLPYLYALQTKQTSPNPYLNNGYNESYVEPISRYITDDFLSKLEPFTLEQGYLLSHAGVHKSFFEDRKPNESHLMQLREKLKGEMRQLPHTPSQELAAVGYSRGGGSPVGGIAWQDWHHEFEDSLPWPQIVGHTILPKPAKEGRSWNLDTRSGTYGILSAEALSVHHLAKE